MNAIQHNLTDQVFTVTQTQRSGEVEPSQRRDSAIGGSSDNESLPRENTFTRAFRQEKRAVRSEVSDRSNEDKTMNASEGKNAGDTVVIRKPGKQSKATPSTDSETQGVEEETLLSTEESPLSDEERETTGEGYESLLTPELVALIKSGMNATVDPTVKDTQSPFAEHLFEEMAEGGMEKGRKLAVTLSAWIQLNEGKTGITTPEELQSKLTELFRTFTQGQGEGEGEGNVIISLSDLAVESQPKRFEEETESSSLWLNTHLIEGNQAGVTQEALSSGEKPLISDLLQGMANESETAAVPNMPIKSENVVASKNADTVEIPLTVEGVRDPVAEEALLSSMPDQRATGQTPDGLSEEPRVKNTEAPVKAPEVQAAVTTGIPAQSSETPIENGGSNTAENAGMIQERAAVSREGEKIFPMSERLPAADQSPDSTMNPMISAMKDIPAKDKGANAQPEKMGYPINAKPNDEGTQKPAVQTDLSSFQRKAGKAVQTTTLSQGAGKPVNQPTLWDRYQEMYFQKDIQKVKLDAFTVKVFQKPAPSSEIPFNSAKPLERSEGQQLTNGAKSFENPVFRMATPVKSNVYQDIGTVRGQDIQTALSGIEGRDGIRLPSTEAAESQAVKASQAAEDTSKLTALSQPFSKESGMKEEKGDSQAMNQQSESGWKAQTWGDKEISFSKDLDTNLREIAQRIKDLAALSATRSRTVESAVIRLNPPELGRLVLEVVKEGNSVVVLMKVETQEAKEMLEKNAHLLTQRLAQTGFEAQKIQVTMEKYEEQGQGQQDAQKERSSDQERQQKENENTKENNNDEPVYQSFAELLAGI